MIKLKPSFQIMFLTSAVFAVFYPTLFAEICLIDDYGAITDVFNNDNLSFWNIFLPRNVSGGYYRPLIGLSYWFDKKAWFLDEHLMHFEGIVGHLLNAYLVYLICRKAGYLYIGKRDTGLSLAASLLFSLHPIVTESVNWISGRTDIMMSTFVLLSVFMIFTYQETGKHWSLFLGLISAFIAVLAKETAFGYLVGIPFLISNRSNDEPFVLEKYKFKLIRFLSYYACAVLVALFVGSYWLVLLICCCYFAHLMLLDTSYGFSLNYYNVRRVIIFAVSLSFTALLFIALRKAVFTSSVAKIGQTLTLMFADTSYTISLFIGAVGFYVKKFFIPLPLNFFILEIDPLYDLLGIAIFLLCMHLLIARTLPAILFIIGFLLIGPALPLVFGTIAWTAYAERYIYLSSAFWSIALALSGITLIKRFSHFNTTVVGATAMTCFVAATLTYNRNNIWKTNVTLMRNTVDQSPKRRNLRDIYINALVNTGRLDEAEKEYRYVTEHLPTADNDYKADLLVGGLMVKEGRTADALKLYQSALIRTKFTSEPLLVSTIRLLQNMKGSGKIAQSDVLRLSELEREYSAKLYAMTKNPLLLIEGGTIAMQTGSFLAAYASFDAALRHMTPGDRLRRTAEQRQLEVRKHLEQH